MALSINDPEVEALARELAEKTGESVDQALLRFLRERLSSLRRSEGGSLADELDRIALSYAAQPVLDDRDPDEILGYDENGLPT